MGAESFAELPADPPAPVPLPDPLPAIEPGGTVHLVVVRSRPVVENTPEEGIETRYWHPGRRCWVEQGFESLEHALHLFVDESGWVLRQRQGLGRAGAFELIFEVRRGELEQSNAKELLLEEVGLSPQDADALLDRVDDRMERNP